MPLGCDCSDVIRGSVEFLILLNIRNVCHVFLLGSDNTSVPYEPHAPNPSKRFGTESFGLRFNKQNPLKKYLYMVWGYGGVGCNG